MTRQQTAKAAEAVMEIAGKLVGGLGFALSYNLEDAVEDFDRSEAIAATRELAEVTGTVLIALNERAHDGDSDGCDSE